MSLEMQFPASASALALQERRTRVSVVAGFIVTLSLLAAVILLVYTTSRSASEAHAKVQQTREVCLTLDDVAIAVGGSSSFDAAAVEQDMRQLWSQLADDAPQRTRLATLEPLIVSARNADTGVSQDDIRARLAEMRKVEMSLLQQQTAELQKIIASQPWAFVRSVAMCTATLSLFYTLAVAHLNQRRKAAGAAGEAGRKAEEEVKLRNTFMARAHCDIRSALTAIVGYCDLPAESPTPVQERFDSIRRQASQIMTAINEILRIPGKPQSSGMSDESRMEALPQTPEPEPAPAAPQESTGPRFKGRVLLAEDNPDLQQVIKYYLQSVGAEVTIVSDGEKACEQAIFAWKQGNTFDLVLMDVQMPKSDGRAATIFLRDTGYTEPIVAITANATDQERGRCFAAGCNGFLTKPVDQEEFLRTMTRYLKPALPTEEKPPQPPLPTAEDAEFAALRQSFESEIPGRIREISTALSAENFTKVADLAHQLKGTSGCFGFTEIYSAAAALQAAAESPEIRERVLECFTALGREIGTTTAKAA